MDSSAPPRRRIFACCLEKSLPRTSAQCGPCTKTFPMRQIPASPDAPGGRSSVRAKARVHVEGLGDVHDHLAVRLQADALATRRRNVLLLLYTFSIVVAPLSQRRARLHHTCLGNHRPYPPRKLRRRDERSAHNLMSAGSPRHECPPWHFPCEGRAQAQCSSASCA